MKKKCFLLIFFTLILLAQCNDKKEINHASRLATDPLPSWNEGNSKKSILEFVKHVTDPDHPQFVHKKDRIVVFDNDGTLWSEGPIYFLK